MRTLQPGLSGDDPLTTVRLPQRSLSSQSFGIVLITQPEQPKDSTQQRKLTTNKKGP